VVERHEVVRAPILVRSPHLVGAPRTSQRWIISGVIGIAIEPTAQPPNGETRPVSAIGTSEMRRSRGRANPSAARDPRAVLADLRRLVHRAPPQSGAPADHSIGPRASPKDVRLKGRLRRFTREGQMGSRLCGGRDDGMRPVDGVDACKERHSAAGRSRPVGVLVADEQRLFVEAIEIAIATDERLHAVGYALDGMELIRLAGALQPQVIAVQAELPWLDGFTSMRHLRLLCPESRVLLLSESGRARDHARALAAGAAGCVSKRAGLNELVDALLSAAQPPRPQVLAERLGKVFRA
jgi:CheY-like chemotaxis protein